MVEKKLRKYLLIIHYNVQLYAREIRDGMYVYDIARWKIIRVRTEDNKLSPSCGTPRV